jgi:FG-GAP-like repeat/FG-GAP repeat
LISVKKFFLIVPGLLFTVCGEAQTTAARQFVAATNINPSTNVGGAFAAGDINHDGKLDILSYDQTAGFVVLLGTGAGTFTEKKPTTAIQGGSPELADLNGDGYLDLVTLNPGDTDNDGLGTSYGTMRVYLGDGSGDFHLVYSANIGAGVASAGIGDVNGDGRPDVITNTSQTFQGTGNMQVFLNKGSATFQEHNAGISLGISAVGDLNGDGKADIVGTNGQGYEALLSNGNGTFTVAGSSGDYVFNAFDPIVIGDFNKDGHPDIAIMDSDKGTSILLGKGDGSFTLKSQLKSVFPGYPGGLPNTLPRAMAFADMNHDGKLDLVSYSISYYLSPSSVTPTNFPFGFVSVNIGNGDGTFKSAPNYSVTIGEPGGNLAVGDFTGDGNPDVIEGGFDQMNAVSTGFMQMVLGSASGALQAPVNTLSADPFSIVHADFNHDGIQDVAVVNQGCAGCNTTVSVYLGSGKGYFNAPKTFTIAQSQGSIAAGDINGDGKIDLVVTRGGQAYITPAAVPAAAQASTTSDDISVLLGNGDGTFKPAVNSVLLGPAGTSNSAWLVDMNRDGKLDLVGDWGVALGRGDGTFKPPVAFPTKAYWIDGVGIGDFNGDGIQDVVIWAGQAGQIDTMLGTGNGTFTEKSLITYPHYVITDLKVAKMYGTAERDLVFCGESVDAANATLSTNLVATVHGNGDGTFGTKKIVPLPSLPLSVNYGDFDRDGKLDVVVNDRLEVVYLRGTATGSFYAPQFYPGAPTYLQTLDVNGDGVLDVVGIDPIGFERLINTGKRN